MKKEIAIVGVALILILSFVFAPTWRGDTSYAKENTFTIARGHQAADGSWSFAIDSDYPQGFNNSMYLMEEDEGLRFFVKTPSGEYRTILQIYTGEASLWDGQSYFVIEGTGIYGDFSRQKYFVRDVVEKFGQDNVLDESFDYFLPSEDRRIFKLSLDLDTFADNQLILHYLEIVNQNLLLEDLSTHLKDGTKVSIGGAPSNTTEITELELSPSPFDKRTDAKLNFSFTAAEDLWNGYAVLISKKDFSGSQENLKEAFESVTLPETFRSDFFDVLLFDSDATFKEGQMVLNEIDKTVSGPSGFFSYTPVSLEEKDTGKYLVLMYLLGGDHDDIPTVTNFLEIKQEGGPCTACDSLLKCLACVDKDKFVKTLFK